MRSVITLSVPPELEKKIRQSAKRQGVSISRYIARSVELEQALISEDEILESVREAQKEYDRGEVYSGLDALREVVYGKKSLRKKKQTA